MTTHATVLDMSPKQRNAFKAKLMEHPETGCLLWSGWVHPDGYGRTCIWLANRPQTFRAHRIALSLWHFDNELDPYDEALEVKWECDNKLCCNPQHMTLQSKAHWVTDRWTARTDTAA